MAAESVLDEDIYYTSRLQWRWVFKEAVATLGIRATLVASVRELPSTVLPSASKSRKFEQQQQMKSLRTSTPPPLRVEIREGTRGGWYSSNAFHYLGDKANLVDALRRTQCQWAAPPSIVIPWNISLNTELEQASKKLRDLWQAHTLPDCLVLKPSAACGGSGIVYVQNLNDAISEIDRNAQNALEEEGFLDFLQSRRGSIPRWVLQNHIESRLIYGGRKFHVRAYAVYDETSDGSLMLLTGRYEVRIACDPYDTLPGMQCKRSAHMTNGAGGTSTTRVLFHEVDELADTRVKLDCFLKRLLAKDSLGGLVSDLASDLTDTTQSYKTDCGRKPAWARSLAMCAMDLMLDKYDRWWLLEINADAPGAPPEEAMPANCKFRHHLALVARDLMVFALGGRSEGWEVVS